MKLKSTAFHIEIARLGPKYLVTEDHRSSDAGGSVLSGSTTATPMLFDTKEQLVEWLKALPGYIS